MGLGPHALHLRVRRSVPRADDPTLGARFWLDVAVVAADPPRARARRGDAEAADAVSAYEALTAAISFRTDSLASPKSIVVFGSR